MKNVPRKIFLQVGEETSTKDNVDFKELGGVSWCTERIHKTDIEYVLKPKKTKLPKVDKSRIEKYN